MFFSKIFLERSWARDEGCCRSIGMEYVMEVRVCEH